MKKKLIFVINSLEIGGAEKFLFNLIKHLPEEIYSITVYPLSFRGALINEYTKLPIELINTSNFSFLNHFSHLKNYMIISSIAFSFLYRSDLLVILTKIFFNLKIKIVWNLRFSKTNILGNKFFTYCNILLNSLLSKYTDAITYNSKLSFQNHKKIGYKFNNHYFFPNGFIDNSSNKRTNKLAISNPILIGNLSRVDYQKNHHFLINEFSSLYKNNNYDVYLFLVGRGIFSKNISNQITKLGIQDRVFRIEQVKDPSLFYELIDIYVSTSRSESFSNSIAEAVFNNKPILVSNVGDNNIYFKNNSVYNNLDSKDFQDKLKAIISSNDDKNDYNYFKTKFTIFNSVFKFQEIIDSLCKMR
jgi:glycosyltransferase involved in cell wall biosynthesis